MGKRGRIISNIKYELVSNEEQFKQWRAFAATFDHDAESPTMPIITFSNENYMLGHFHVLQNPIIFPAFHPRISPRELKQAVDGIISYYSLSSMGIQYPNGVVYCALPRGRGEEFAGKFGFEKLNVDLYRRIP